MEVYMLFAKLGERHQLLGQAKEPNAYFVQLYEDEVRIQELTREVKSDDLLSYPVKLVKNLLMCRPGAVYKMEKTETGISYTPKSPPAFAIKTNEQITRWHAETRATQRAWEARKRLEKDVKNSPDREHLEPFRKAYRRLHAPAQAQLIADVVAYITSSPTKA